MKEGFILLHRSLQHHWLYPRKRRFSRLEAWVDLLYEAAFAEHKVTLAGRVIVLQRGDVPHSVRTLAERWNWSKSSVQRFLDRLETESMVERKAGQGPELLHVVNYDTYQALNAESGTDAGQQPGQTRDNHNKGKRKGQKTDSAPPSLEEFKAYCATNGFGHIAERAYRTYAAADWHDTKGNKVRNWKQKLQAVWFDAERNPPPKDTSIIYEATPDEQERARRIMEGAYAS